MPRATSDPVDGAHLTGRSRPSPVIHRYPGPADLDDLVRRYWIPVWNLDAPQQQFTLQHPVALIVVSNTYQRFYGVQPGLSGVTLEDEGWAFGVMLRPAAGRLLWGRSMAELTGTHVELSALETIDGSALGAAITRAMEADPHSPASHAEARAAVEGVMREFAPVDEPGRLVNAVVDWLEQHPEVTRVDEVTDQFGVSERTLQRVVRDRCGISPKWLIQRRRLHDAVHSLKQGQTSLADLAASLGYTDQAHFTHDFRLVTGMTPGQYLADQG